MKNLITSLICILFLCTNLNANTQTNEPQYLEKKHTTWELTDENQLVICRTMLLIGILATAASLLTSAFIDNSTARTADTTTGKPQSSGKLF